MTKRQLGGILAAAGFSPYSCYAVDRDHFHVYQRTLQYMPNHPFRLAIALAMLVFPLRAALAATAIPADQITAIVRPAAQQFRALTASAGGPGKTYTVKNDFTVTLPSDWKNLPSSSITIFAAQPTNNNAAQLIMTLTKYTTQKTANDANALLTKTPDKYGQLILKGFQKEFTDKNCTLKNTGKKTIGSNTGARANVICGPAGSQYTFSTFSFIHKLTYYAVAYAIPTSQSPKLMPKFDAVTATIKFLK